MKGQILKQILAPSINPVLLEESKNDCRVEHGIEDALIDSMISDATDYMDGPEGVIGKALITQTWSLSLPCPDRKGRVDLPVTPVQSIQSVSYFDADNVSQTLSINDFYLYGDDYWAYIEPRPGSEWPAVYDRLDAITVTFKAGFGDKPESVPGSIRRAIRMLVLHWYENRGVAIVGQSVSTLPMALQSLISVNRKGWVG